MPLSAGVRVGPYEITGTLGAGGMGEVYRARDAKLGRTVALKILPALVADDAERIARFEREARTLAALNHPNIAQVYGFEQSAGGSALVMELVEGEDLATRLARGAIPLDDALPIARQIALALEGAHDLGIIHRDLKPANIKLRADGTVKVLDFGLAKALDDGAGAGPDQLNSPTITSANLTARGIVLGTAAYMSPEQARGKTVDRRADIWAFGVVLFEMVTGRHAFAGETVSDTIAAVLTREPDLNALPAATPASVRYVLERCLQKDPARRFHHIADARLELERLTLASAAPARAGGRWVAVVATAVVVAAVTSAGWWFFARRAPEQPRYSLTIPGAGFNSIGFAAISRDGRWIAYSPNAHAAPFRLMVRSLDTFESREVASSSSTHFSPFFSPDGEWLGFFDDYTLYKVAVRSGVPERVGQVVPGNSEGAWAADGSIVVSANFRVDNAVRTPLLRISARGGAFEVITRAGPSEAHRDPHILPGDRVVLFTLAQGQTAAVAAVPLAGGEPTTILTDARRPRYTGDGYLLFQRVTTGDLMAVAFDVSRLEVTGDPVRIEAVARIVESAAFDVSHQGTLIYSAPADSVEESGFKVVAVDRSGVETPLVEDPGTWATPRVSPDGRTLVIREIVSPDCVFWTLDLARGIRTRFNHPGDNHEPIWRPDGQLSWGSQAQAVRGIRIARVDRPAPATTLGESPFERVPASWSPDGTLLALTETHPQTKSDILLLAADTGESKPFAATPAEEREARFSRDGRWIAYVSNESGREEVWLQALGADGTRLQLSSNSGHSPVWSPNGRELFFVEGSRLMAVEVDLAQRPVSVSRPRKLLEGPYVWERLGNYDITPDGKRFIFVSRGANADPSTTLRILLNWHAPR